ncbi:MAG: hypothetical protein EOO91_05805 [Pedobacter sp.]|nr:MAG: hypothetical protein EOO91_05805 [Pedobacter sp.]
MKTLNLKEMEAIEGGNVTTCHASGALVAGAIVFGAIGIATGGLGFAVGAGLSAYFGATTGLICAMEN